MENEIINDLVGEGGMDSLGFDDIYTFTEDDDDFVAGKRPAGAYSSVCCAQQHSETVPYFHQQARAKSNPKRRMEIIGSESANSTLPGS